ncbi:hypothetical protein DC366_10990 [Pelagivirga sediminicola]|uniref:DUF995 domain-containing protein n=1 Tax=Pelagivirga sediminicola TaxID=2170575 RepID=A0A2T7G700_9RHOB|nr:hypothetical protein [Pelagivirga sediminicola]PVA10167.1 hypothetical protein DC366_10990 [Pelagivirga sediminicola]
MIRRFFLIATAACALLTGALATAALAQGTVMEAAEIERLLTGNTAEGQWDGASYKSYFGPGGTTVFVPSDGAPLRGKWRVNPETNQYESFFDAVGWTGYTILRTDAGFAWVLNDKAYPFAVIEGRALSF